MTENSIKQSIIKTKYVNSTKKTFLLHVFIFIERRFAGTNIWKIVIVIGFPKPDRS